ncbi:LemA family protein [uncultured Aeromicrobium sp.]|uniref:LemA family protein n=1 Tax=uncultured Aeromicrobium sp. TaxID=337820 RepID=UPI0025EC699F|nr:LemA family protein [uncultured Aeromicrobium sp.]
MTLQMIALRGRSGRRVDDADESGARAGCHNRHMELVAAVIVALIGLLALALVVRRRRARRAMEVRAITTRLRSALQRAAEPIPALLDAIGEYASWERAVFAEARAAADDAMAAQTAEEAVAAYERFVAATNDLFAIVEVYPDLSADEDTAAKLHKVEQATDEAAVIRGQLAPLLPGRTG